MKSEYKFLLIAMIVIVTFSVYSNYVLNYSPVPFESTMLMSIIGLAVLFMGPIQIYKIWHVEKIAIMTGLSYKEIKVLIHTSSKFNPVKTDIKSILSNLGFIESYRVNNNPKPLPKEYQDYIKKYCNLNTMVVFNFN